MQSLEEFTSGWNILSLEKLEATVLKYLMWSPVQTSEYVIVI